MPPDRQVVMRDLDFHEDGTRCMRCRTLKHDQVNADTGEVVIG